MTLHNKILLCMYGGAYVKFDTLYNGTSTSMLMSDMYQHMSIMEQEGYVKAIRDDLGYLQYHITSEGRRRAAEILNDN